MRSTLVALIVSSLAVLAACPASPVQPAVERRTTPTAAPRPVWDRLADAAWEVRRDAVKELASDASERALAALATALRDPRPEVSEAAAQELVPRGGPAAAALLRGAGPGAGRAVQERVTAVLVKLGAAALPALRQATESPQPAVRRLAVDVLARLPDPGAVLPLLGALGDLAEDVRAAASTALRGRKDAASLDRMLAELRLAWFGPLHALLGVLHDHPDPRVAAVVLEKFGSTSNTFSLHELLSMLVARDGAWYAKLATGLASGKVPVRAGVLRALRYDAASLERIQGAAVLESDTALGAWAGAERAKLAAALQQGPAKQALRKLLADPDAETRHAATQLLAAAGEKVDRARAERELVQSLERRIAALLKPRKGAQAPAAEGPEALVILQAQLGELLWKQSCRVPEVNGLCLTVKELKVKGQASLQRTVQYEPRAPALVKRAKAAYDKAIAAWQDGKVVAQLPASAPDRARRTARSRHYAAWAHFMLGEILLQDLLRTDVPPRIAVDRKTGRVNDASFASARSWAQRKEVFLKQAIAEYGQALNRVKAAIGGRERRSTFWGVAALARAGQVWEWLAARVGSLALPPLKPEDQKALTGWRDELLRTIRGRASAEYLQCLKSSDRLLRFWEWGLVCESGLVRTDPKGHDAWHRGNPFQGFRAPHPAPAPAR